jgi:hypothetical protein
MKSAHSNDYMKEREEKVGATWVDEGDGYFSLTGNTSFCQVAYIKIPDKHPLAGRRYSDEVFYDVDVNGGLTYSEGTIYGWDYGHSDNNFEVVEHIKNAIDFFKEFNK